MSWRKSVSSTHCLRMWYSTEERLFVSLCLEKEDQCLTPEAWNVDQGVISRLKEQYKKERKGKKGVKSKWEHCLNTFTSASPISVRCQCSPNVSFLLLTSFLLTVSQGLKLVGSCLTVNLNRSHIWIWDFHKHGKVWENISRCIWTVMGWLQDSPLTKMFTSGRNI